MHCEYKEAIIELYKVEPQNKIIIHCRLKFDLSQYISNKDWITVTELFEDDIVQSIKFKVKIVVADHADQEYIESLSLIHI